MRKEDALAEDFEETYQSSKQLTAFKEKQAIKTLAAELRKNMPDLPGAKQTVGIDPALPGKERTVREVRERSVGGATVVVSAQEIPKGDPEIPKMKQVAQKSPSANGAGAESVHKTSRANPWYVFCVMDGKNVYVGPAPTRKAAEKHAKGCGVLTQRQAIPPGSPVVPWSQIPPAQRKAQPWDGLADEIARVFFEARDRAGMNAVMGRVGPILHGDKRSNRCGGILAYECERQGVSRDQLDYPALVAFVQRVWTYFQAKNPGKELKDCAKVLDNWQACRGLQAPPPAAKPKPVYHIHFTQDENGKSKPNPCYCEIGANHD